MKKVIVVIGNSLGNEDCVLAVCDLSEISEEVVRKRYEGKEFSFDIQYLQTQI